MASDREQEPLLRSTLGKLAPGIVHTVHTENTEITHITPDLKQLVNEQVAAYLKSPEFREICRELVQRAQVPQESIEESKASLEHVKNMFSSVEQVSGLYFRPVADGYDIVVTYPKSMRFAQALKALVPIEMELTRSYKGTSIDFQYLSVKDFSEEEKATYEVLFERQEPTLGA